MTWPPSSGEPDLIVLHHDPAIHPSAWVPLLEGRWYDLARMPKIERRVRVPIMGGTAVAVPTGRFEADELGRVAEVFEIRLGVDE